MGASVSVGSNLPPTLTEAQVQEICGDQYNPQWFMALRSEENTVSTEDLITVVKSKVERAVMLLYFTYCPTGRMKNSAFFAMCRESKLLAKADFSIRKAEQLFDTVLGKTEEVETRTISYRTFRFKALPDIASRKSWPINKVLKRLSDCEKLIEEKNELRKARFNVRVSSNVDEIGEVTAEDCLEGVNNSINITSMFNASQQNAVVKIQSITRQKNSKKEVKRRQELLRLETSEEGIEVKEEDMPDEGDQSEILLKTYYFKLVGASGEMNKRHFYEFLRNGHALDKELTPYDCQFIFNKALLVAGKADSTFQDCIMPGKCLLYPAVRILALPQVSLFKGMATSKFIQQLAAAYAKSDSTSESNQGKAQDTTSDD